MNGMRTWYIAWPFLSTFVCRFLCCVSWSLLIMELCGILWDFFSLSLDNFLFHGRLHRNACMCVSAEVKWVDFRPGLLSDSVQEWNERNSIFGEVPVQDWIDFIRRSSPFAHLLSSLLSVFFCFCVYKIAWQAINRCRSGEGKTFHFHRAAAAAICVVFMIIDLPTYNKEHLSFATL